MDPTSTKNGSSRWPAKNLMPLLSVLTDAEARAAWFGVERGPMLGGATLALDAIKVPLRRTA